MEQPFRSTILISRWKRLGTERGDDHFAVSIGWGHREFDDGGLFGVVGKPL